MWMSHSEPDYYIFFIKAWIPFNAWYVNAYPALNNSDTEIIKSLQDDLESKPKKIIKAFIENKVDHDSLKFQSYFSELHYYLERSNISHNGHKLTFKSLYLTENPLKYAPFTDDKNNVYKAEKTSSYVQAYIQQKGGKVLLDHKKPSFDIDSLKRDNEYLRLDAKMQTIILNLYNSINPKQPISVIANLPKIKESYISLKSKNPCKIINDSETVAKACIKVLYALRCMLFHGEITPTDSHKKIYENAYKLLRLTINELR